MNRNHALIDLAPGQELPISEKQLGAFFCGETFVFVLNPCTRRAAERVARWHGCRFRFNQTNGRAGFVKRDGVTGLVVSSFEAAALWCAHVLWRVRLEARAAMSGRSEAGAHR